MHLLQLAISAQQHPPRSPGRQIALTKLVNGIVRFGRLCHPQKSQFPAQLYQDIYNEARQELLLYICENIDKYDAERGSVMTWVNVLLERRFFKDAIRKIQAQQGMKKITITDLDNLIASPEEPPDRPDRNPEGMYRIRPRRHFQKRTYRKMSSSQFSSIGNAANIWQILERDFWRICHKSSHSQQLLLPMCQ